MSYTEDLLKLRKRMSDVIVQGLVDPANKDFYEATLIQIMNDAERNRQTCLNTVENLRRQMLVAEGQAQAFASVSGIVYNVLNGFINQAEKAKEEEARRAAELAEIEENREVVDSNIETVVNKRKKK